jgi:hypothetical protein
MRQFVFPPIFDSFEIIARQTAGLHPLTVVDARHY